jgi:hypothetical protein
MAPKRPPQEDYDLNPLKPTAGQRQPEPADNADLDEGRIISAGVGITEGELAAVDSIADRVGVKRNALMRLAVRLFIEQVRAGEIRPDDYFLEPERPAKRLKIGKQAKRGG